MGKNIAFLSTPIFTHSVFLFLLESQVIFYHHFLSVQRTYFSHSSRGGHLWQCSWSFFTENVFISPALLKATFTVHVIHRWQLWSFSTWQILSLFLQASMIQTRNPLSSELLLFYRYHIIFFFVLKKYYLAFSYHKFDYYLSWCQFLWIYPC